METERGMSTGNDCNGAPRNDPRHAYEYLDDEYGGLAGGGDYEIHKCTKCGRRKYVELPD